LLKLHVPDKVSKADKKQLDSMKSSLNPTDQLQRILDDAAERRANE
jgi:hypothetical protein